MKVHILVYQEGDFTEIYAGKSREDVNRQIIRKHVDQIHWAYAEKYPDIFFPHGRRKYRVEEIDD